jgi:glycosyltransferase involved in cell wall biosynthesis
VTKKKILVLADVPGWAWDHKGRQYVQHLNGSDFDVALAYHATLDTFDVTSFDLVHCFEVSQLRAFPLDYPVPIVAGLTAHVWRTWTSSRMHEWAARCVGLHGNSVMLVDDLKRFHERVYYTPNGVDPEFWRPARPTGASGAFPATPDRRAIPFTVCHVGKPNPRKGSALIIEACRRADVKLLLCQRTSHIKLPPEQIRRLYWNAHVQITCSDMDGTPNPMLEAAACENIPISNPIGNMPELIVNGVNGHLVDPPVLPNPFRPYVAVCAKCSEREGVPSTCEHGPDPEIRDALIDEMASTLRGLSRLSVEEVSRIGHNARQSIVNDWTWQRQVMYVARMWHDVLATVAREGRS